MAWSPSPALTRRGGKAPAPLLPHGANAEWGRGTVRRTVVGARRAVANASISSVLLTLATSRSSSANQRRACSIASSATCSRLSRSIFAVSLQKGLRRSAVALSARPRFGLSSPKRKEPDAVSSPRPNRPHHRPDRSGRQRVRLDDRQDGLLRRARPLRRFRRRRDRHRGRLFGVGSRKSGRRIGNDHRRVDEGARRTATG